ncbi:hypothetical protein [Clostridium senegalense]
MATGRVNVGGTPFYNKLNNLQSGKKVELININKDYDIITTISHNVYKDDTTYAKSLSSETEITCPYDGHGFYWVISINGVESNLTGRYSAEYSICPVFLYIEKNGLKSKLRFSFATYENPGTSYEQGYPQYFEKEFDYTPNTNIYITNSWGYTLTVKNYIRVISFKN